MSDSVISPTRSPIDSFVKFGFDYIAASALLLFCVPLFIVLGFVISLDGGPVLFCHGRIGSGGRRFGCLKFRSMVTNADEVLDNLLRTDAGAAREWADTQKLRNDPRITKIGRLLRKTSLDEIPQFINVLCGEMSLVGPRPITAKEILRYGDDYYYYIEARPGITGLWQVSGRNDTTYEERVRLDVLYIQQWSVWRDFAILLKTIPVVVRRRGAN